MKAGQIVIVQGLTLSISGLLLKQDEALRILEVDNSTVTFERLEDGTVNTVSKMALEFGTE